MIYRVKFMLILALFSSQDVLADSLDISEGEIVGEWKLLATQLGETGPKIEDDGSSMVIFTGNGKVIEKSGFGSLERDYFIEDGKLFVKAPFGAAEWMVTAKSENEITLKTSTGILYLERKR